MISISTIIGLVGGFWIGAACTDKWGITTKGILMTMIICTLFGVWQGVTEYLLKSYLGVTL